MGVKRIWCNTCNAHTISVSTSNRTSHLFHLVMSIITFGLWIPVWLLVAIVNSSGRDLCSKCAGAS